MHSFKDAAGRDWAVSITVLAVKRVEGLLAVKLYEMDDASLFQRIGRDPVFLCDLLCVLCAEQIHARQMTPEQFLEGMRGDGLAEAATAMLEELLAFFPHPLRGLLEKAAQKLRRLEAIRMQLADQRLSGTADEEAFRRDLEAEARKMEESASTSGAPSMNLPASPG